MQPVLATAGILGEPKGTPGVKGDYLNPSFKSIEAIFNRSHLVVSIARKPPICDEAYA
jgi:hypothetical protein